MPASKTALYFVFLQDIVPQSLLENYLGMIDPSKAQTVDTEITKNCAYSLPAVAYTLGRENWHCIKNLYETLAADMQVEFYLKNLPNYFISQVIHKCFVFIG